MNKMSQHQNCKCLLDYLIGRFKVIRFERNEDKLWHIVFDGTLMASHKVKLCKAKKMKHCSGCFWQNKIVVFFLEITFGVANK